MATIVEIAKLAGVSPMSVSNVINKKYNKVSQTTVDKVNKIIKDVNYVPNLSARSLASNNSKIIVLVIPQNIKNDDTESSTHNPFYGEIINSIEHELSKFGYYLMLRFVSNMDDFKTTISNWNADGVILLGVYESQIKKELNDLSIPFVLVDSYVQSDKFCIVNSNDFGGGFTATGYMIDRGCKSIGVVSSFLGAGGVMDQRVAGYKKAIESNNLELKSDNIFEINPTYEEGYKLGKLIGSNKDGLDGLFVCSDLVAVGIIRGLKEMNVNIPDDISVVGFDGLIVGEMTEPTLTTIKQDINVKGIEAVYSLMGILDGGDTRVLNLPVELIKRNSVI